jgi:phosphate starvation-inducible protein PhoH and related proteins
MIEKTIYLEGIDPLTFYGTNNKNLDKLKSSFPKLKIIARGVEMKVIGDHSGISRFEDDIDRLLEFAQHKNQLSEEDIENILTKKAGTGNTPDLQVEDIIVYGNQGKAVQAKTVNQKRLILEYAQNDLIFAIGPAGTGKTYTAIALAVRALKNREVKRVILTRPAVEAGEKLGFLPGDVKQKLDPYLLPLYDALGDMIPHKKLESYIEEGTVEIAPLAYMRGRTLGDAFVILDEGQNTTVNQMKMFLTRMGKNAKFIVTGDITQIDLPERRLSGLIRAIKLLSGIKGISVIEFDTRDIVRHRLVKHIVHAYENYKSEQEEA